MVRIEVHHDEHFDPARVRQLTAHLAKKGFSLTDKEECEDCETKLIFTK